MTINVKLSKIKTKNAPKSGNQKRRLKKGPKTHKNNEKGR